MVLPLASFIIALIANICLAILVLRRNYQSATNNLFALLAIILAGWATVNYISFVTEDYNIALWTIRLVLTSAILQSVVVALLLKTLPRSTIPFSSRSLLAISAITFLGFVTTLSPFLVTSIELRPGLVPQTNFSWGMALFIPITFGSLIWGTAMLIKKNINSVGIERIQQRYVLIGLIITFSLLIGLILLMVAVKKDYRFVPYAPLFTLPFVVATSYAIIRYRLMDIRAVIFRAAGFSVLAGGFFIIYGLIIYAVTSYLDRFDLSPLQHTVLGITTVILAIPSFQYFRTGLRRLTDRFLFQSRADYRAALVKIGDTLSGTINIDDVTDTVLAAMKEVIRSKKTIIFLQDPADKEFIPRALAGVRHFRVTIPHEHVLLQHLRHAPGPLVKDELALLKEQERSPRHIEEIEQIENALTWLDASVVLPLFVNKELTGIIALGDKLSGEPYLQDDTNFLAALAPQAATALENARLYQESLEFGQKLKVEVQRATSELAVANDQLRDLDKAKSEFLSIASHQLYTPLTALRGYLSMIKEGDFGATPPKQRPILDILEVSADRLIELIKGLLDISRIESGRLELNLESVDLVEMVREMVRDLLPNANKKKLQLEFEEPAQPLPHAVVDRQRIRQVMLNFIDNAIKYTPAGRIDVTVRRQGDELIFAVTDTGKGLQPEEMNRLFSKFTRVGGADRFHTEGTGLGLYVAKQMVEEHHGRVEVESPGPNEGSTFSMHLPIEGSSRSLKVGEKTSVAIKAAD